MDSPSDLFSDSSPQIHAFTSTLSSTDLPGGHPQGSAGCPLPAFRPPGFPLIHHLLQPGGAHRKIGGHLNKNLSAHRHPEDRNMEENTGERDEQVEPGMEEGEEGDIEEVDDMLRVKKRRSDAALAAEWSQDVLKVKRMKLERRQRDGKADGEADAGGRCPREGAREGRRREREELKEQLEEARERLQALQEKVWRAFGEKHMEEEKKKSRLRNGSRRAEDREDLGLMEEEDITEGMYDEEDIDGGEVAKEPFLNLSGSPFDDFHKRREERHKEKERKAERGGGGGGLSLGDAIEGAGLWLDCGGLVRGDWGAGLEEEGEEGGQKFAQALKLELGSAVARVIDRVLRLYTETIDLTPSSPPAAVSFLPPDGGGDGRREVWMGLLARERGGEKTRGKEEKVGGQDGEREKQLQKMNGSAAPPPPQTHRSEPADLTLPLAVQRSPDVRKAHPLLGTPLSAHLNASHPNLSLHHATLPRPPPLTHPPLLPPAAQPKDPSSSFHLSSSSSSSSSSSFPAPAHPHPPPPPPLPLPLLHYSMQQLFSRSLHHPQLSHLPPSRKDYLSSDPFLEVSSHTSSHPSFPPLPLLGHLDPSLARHAHGGRDRERGMRGDGGMRGGGMDGGELYLTAGGTQEGLSPCHLKKAKLMFFYTRYPSSNTLKTYFPDVKFNRCVTSQMIKWFSNFREFFYIQMERFARQAVRDMLTRDGAPCLGRDNQLRVGRDTELYRILNMHYNKSNVYQVPERFIEVSEVALREFYSAIWTGRDSDPCWKKGIYKIICKLDSPVPDAFRLPGCPVG